METKVNLTITIPGRVLYSEEECAKTGFYDKFQISIEDLSSKGKKSKTERITVTTRKCKPASISLNINSEAYNYMVSPEVPSWIKKASHWSSMSKKQRLESHLARIMEHMNGLTYSYTILED